MVAKVPSFISAAPSPSRTKTGAAVLSATPRAMPLAPPMEPTWYKCCGRSARVKSSRPHLPVVAMTAPSAGTRDRKRSNAAARVGRSSAAAAGKSARRPGAGSGRSAAPSACSATSPLRMTKAKGRPLARIASVARAKAVGRTPGDAGKGACGTPMTESRSCVMRPISACCGSSGMPGSPRHVVIIRVGMRNGSFSEVSGFTALPRPEFWHITTVRRPASHAPAAIATASPSLAAPT
jgi:hypothetical protein